jgi:hypothetical protein|tara:strand:+ start:7590 stop:7811 length:222 start_codon:yes stop_codon:yes gene_type:complete
LPAPGFEGLGKSTSTCGVRVGGFEWGAWGGLLGDRNLTISVLLIRYVLVGGKRITCVVAGVGSTLEEAPHVCM